MLVSDQEGIGKYELTAKLSSEQRKSFEEKSRLRIYEKGQTIYSENYRATDLFVIDRGIVKSVKEGTNGTESIIKLATDRELIGLESIMPDNKYCSTAKALIETTVLVIPGSYIHELSHKNNAVCEFMLMKFNTQLVTLNERILEFANHPPRIRMAKWLIQLDDAYGKEEGIKILREDLASLLGTARETATRILSEFRMAQLIEIQNKKIFVINKKGLLRLIHEFEN